MSNEGHYDQNHSQHHLGSNNPFNQSGAGGPPQYSGQQQQPQQQYGGYAPPPGPPPGQQPRRAGTFQESDFVPEGERGEQREAIQQFEMNKSGNESQQDRDIAQLQREFPSVDGSLIAALYTDAGSLGATKEMLVELAGSQ